MCSHYTRHKLSDLLAVHYQIPKSDGRKDYIWGAYVCLECGSYFQVDIKIPEDRAGADITAVSYEDLLYTLLHDIDNFTVITSPRVP